MDPKDANAKDAVTEPKPHTPKDPASNRALGFIGLGIQFALVVLFCVWLGEFADAAWSTRPLFVLIGLFLGLGSATWQLLRQVQRDARRGKEER